ncbi:MAG: hypothetical protein IPK59_17055 [Rhodospirillaceae bacterium]|nr:hypothetical protein [Rhodospirillaceae bacterium]
MQFMTMRKSMVMVLLLGSAVWTVPVAADEGFDTAHVIGAHVIPTNVIPANVIEANVVDQALQPVDFSEQEAQLWVLNAGYNQVSGLTREGRYVYRGTAMLDGATYDIVVDAEGNILGAKE